MISIEGRPSTAAISARIALELEMVQYDTDEGPCLTSFRTAGPLRIDLAEEGEVFPHFSVAVSRSPEFAAARAVVEQAQRHADDQAEVNIATGLLMINEACTVEQAEGLLAKPPPTTRRPSSR